MKAQARPAAAVRRSQARRDALDTLGCIVAAVLFIAALWMLAAVSAT
jgi:hypothetical protein